MVSPQDIERWIAAALPCDKLEVRGDGQHFEALVVSGEFRGMNMVQQHQLVYKALGDRMREEIHALSMKTYTPEDWVSRQ